MNIRDVLALPDGMPVHGLIATVKSASEVRSGARGDREWSVMNLTIEDSTGETIRVAWWSPTETSWKEVKGRPIEISATKNSKNQLVGAKAEHSTYKGEAQVQIHVNGDCLTFTDEETPATRTTSRGAAPAQAAAAKPQTARDARATLQGVTDIDLIAAIGRWAPLIRFALAHDKAKLNEVPYEPIQALISTLLIAATSDRSTLKIVAGEEAPRATIPPSARADRGEDDFLGGALDLDAPTNEEEEGLWP